jgi:hypothetical protein
LRMERLLTFSPSRPAPSSLPSTPLFLSLLPERASRRPVPAQPGLSLAQGPPRGRAERCFVCVIGVRAVCLPCARPATPLPPSTTTHLSSPALTAAMAASRAASRAGDGARAGAGAAAGAGVAIVFKKRTAHFFFSHTHAGRCSKRKNKKHARKNRRTHARTAAADPPRKQEGGRGGRAGMRRVLHSPTSLSFSLLSFCAPPSNPLSIPPFHPSIPLPLFFHSLLLRPLTPGTGTACGRWRPAPGTRAR